MASPQPALPPGLSPVQAGRIGLWLLGKRAQKAASLRVAFPTRARNGTSLVLRFRKLTTPWRIFEYPGAERFLAALLGIGANYAHNLQKPSARLPAKHARTMADFLANQASQCEALAAELRAYAAAENNRKFTNKPVANGRRQA